MTIRLITSNHLTLFIPPEKLRSIADCLERKAQRRELALASRISADRDVPMDADHYLDEMNLLSCEGQGWQVWFRLPEEAEEGIRP